MYSLNKNGPCINGCKLSCKGYEVASEITCECPPHYQGLFCEDKIENVIEMFFMFIFSCHHIMGLGCLTVWINLGHRRRYEIILCINVSQISTSEITGDKLGKAE